MPPIYNMNIDRGRGFVPVDEQHHSKVAIIGHDIVDNQMGSDRSHRQRDPGRRRANTP